MFCRVDRLINRRQQGDLGEASAIEWLTRQGATVSAPLGHSPDYDLIAEFSGALVRVQVKTSTSRRQTPDGHQRWGVTIRTLGGNQSWSGVSKRFDAGRVDALFVLVGDGRRWFIPASAVEGMSTLNLGGRKYSEFEIEPGAPIIPLVYGARDDGEVTASRIEGPTQGERRRGRVGLDCKSSASLLSGFESLLPHSPPPGAKLKGEPALGRSGQAIIREKRQMTLPAKPFSEAGLQIGDRLRFRADGKARIVIERIQGAQPELATLLTEVRPNRGFR
jgi:Holliday junction resolvase-like predicted endonuclease